MDWQNLIHHNSNTIPKDFSALVVLAGLALIYVWSKRVRQAAGVRFAGFAWTVVGVVATGMYLVGKFPTYYSWMLSLPLAVLLASYYDQIKLLHRKTARMVAVF